MINEIDVQIGIMANQDKLKIYHIIKPISHQIGFETTVQR